MPPPLPPSLRYYTGRLAAYDEDYKKADEHLGYAYEHCHRDAHSNKKKILRYLIPVGNKADTSAPPPLSNRTWGHPPPLPSSPLYSHLGTSTSQNLSEGAVSLLL